MRCFRIYCRKILIFVLAFVMICFPFANTASAASQYGNVYCRNGSNHKKIALTFDDGPHPRYTKEILSILEEHGVTATFFIIGINAVIYPEDLRRIVNSGCEIGNHTYSHHTLNKLSTADMRMEILECERILYELTGIKPKVFRPPQGILPTSISPIVSEAHYNVVLWSIDTRDWAMNPSNEIVKTVLSQLKGGDIILMHDYVSGGNTTCDALRIMIPEILARGYEFVTVSEMINGDHAKA